MTVVEMQKGEQALKEVKITDMTDRTEVFVKKRKKKKRKKEGI